MPARVERRWTAAEVRELQQESRPYPRFELIDGELLVTPSASYPHQRAVLELARLLSDYCDREAVGQTMVSPADLELLPENITQPDVFVIPNSQFPPGDEPMTWKHVKALLLAVEVISPSSVRDDRTRKRDTYLSGNVAEYWIVDLDARMFEVWKATSARPAVAREVLRWRPEGAQSDFELDVVEFFVAVTGKRVI